MQIRLKSCLFPNWINIFLLWNKQTHCGIRTFPGKIKFFFFHSKNRHKWNSECQILKTSRFNLRRVQETLQHFSVKTILNIVCGRDASKWWAFMNRSLAIFCIILYLWHFQSIKVILNAINVDFIKIDWKRISNYFNVI